MNEILNAIKRATEARNWEMVNVLFRALGYIIEQEGQ